MTVSGCRWHFRMNDAAAADDDDDANGDEDESCRCRCVDATI